jgi:hypothetical protein
MRNLGFALAVLCIGSAPVLAACGGGGSSQKGEGDDASPADASPVDSSPADSGPADSTTPTSDGAVTDSSVSADSMEQEDTSVSDGGDGSTAMTSTDGEPDDAPSEVGSGNGSSEGGASEGGASEGGASDAGPDAFSDGGDGGAPPVVANIVVDLFGYRPGDPKIAVVRNPVTGFDAAPFAPGATYALVVASTAQRVLEGPLATWGDGGVDPSSGDAAWSFDFSGYATPGTYYVLDETHQVRSPSFVIASGVYSGPLMQSVRSFYYQRDGIAKQTPYAGAQWTDNAAHEQDQYCTPFADLEAGAPDAGATLDLRGGWFDAADQNKYTIWAASNAMELLRAYREKPGAFGASESGDAYGLPESGNGIPDILDEASWGLEWLLKMQQGDGSVLTMVGNWSDGATTNGADPPSADTAPCVYGAASTSATWSAAAAYAYGALVLQPWNASLASNLATAAANAWTWANANQNDVYDNPAGFGTYDQELTSTGRLEKQIEAAVYLFELTGDATYGGFVAGNYATLAQPVSASRMEQLDAILEYAGLPGAAEPTGTEVLGGFETTVEGSTLAGMLPTDPYRAYIPSYAFTGYLGSNQPKAGQGNMFYDLALLEGAGSGGTSDAGSDAGAAPADAIVADAASSDATTSTGGEDAATSIEGGAGSAATGAENTALDYVHYFHGVNPLGLVYLTNMNGFGATQSLTVMYSAWFTGTPPPGFVTAGPNPGYDWDPCCSYPATSADSCGGGTFTTDQETALCGASPLAPPYGQPPQKSYKDFNTSWPMDSWQVSEANNAYMAQYVRLVSKFVP